MNPYTWIEDKFLERRAQRTADRVLDLLDEYPRLQTWPRTELIALAMECEGFHRDSVRRAARQLAETSRP